ncbi:amidohydrolase [Phycicoccus sp. HDW14]|uniref:amidohydrolase n=1 Tax=Phycicoccus sp. HDW14 TaxID=2714941 RepID=UPI001407BC32|nr:amidohydrolase [Phycicoccus sp. HDW14]QIM20513.1 amidohydrolase [Phycicoccus sp. HDW14]
MVDTIFSGGPVFTAGAVRARPTAVAVEDGRIVAVGHDEVLDLAGPGTERVDLAGRMLVPGFQDAHVHPVWAGVDMLRCDLSDLFTSAQYLERVGEYARSHPEVPWVLGAGWSMPAFPGGTPTAAALDTVVADRPVYLPNRDGHGAWVNSAALRLAGIDRDTPDPRDGRIERDADGHPTGTLHEGAMALVGRLVPPTTEAEQVEGLLLAQAHLHSLGVTAWQDAIIGDYGDGWDPAVAYRAADAAGSLTGRVVGALWWDRGRGLEQVPELVERRATLTSSRFRPTSIKIMQDGVAENFTAAMTEPYCDGHGHRTDNSGISFVPPEVLGAAAVALDAEGFQLHFHAIGDRAVRECLDAVEAALRANGRRDARHHVAHLQVVHPDDVPRFRELGVVANLQAFWAALEAQMVELTLPFLGEPRSSWQYPFGDLLRSGATLAMGSDWAVSTADPLAAIHVAVTRQIPQAHREGEPEHPVFLPEQRLDLASALTAYTAGSAHVNRLDDTGTVRVGALADLAVLDRDPFAHPPEEIGDTRVLRTFVEGRQVFAAADA